MLLRIFHTEHQRAKNFNLSFFDFATFFKDAPEYSPSVVCILNKGLFGLVENGKVRSVYEPSQNVLPALYPADKDTLLVYLCFLLDGMGATFLDIFAGYVDLLSSIECFYFETDFLDTIQSSESAKNTARKCFLRRASDDIKDLYAEARKALGLP